MYQLTLHSLENFLSFKKIPKQILRKITEPRTIEARALSFSKHCFFSSAFVLVLCWTCWFRKFADLLLLFLSFFFLGKISVREKESGKWGEGLKEQRESTVGEGSVVDRVHEKAGPISVPSLTYITFSKVGTRSTSLSLITKFLPFSFIIGIRIFFAEGTSIIKRVSQRVS